MTKAITRAFNAVRAVSAPVTLAPPCATSQRMRLPQAMARLARRPMSVVQALHWAFGAECASLDFDEVNPDAYVVGTDPVWRLMRQAELGCRVDGGGRSASADDAEVIASILARLPVAQGGKPMAALIACHARTGTAPDWMPDASPRCVPKGWFTNRHGTTACTEVVGKVEMQSRGRKVVHDVVACPVTYTPTAAQIASARRGYLDWWGALLHLQHELSHCGLATIEITSAMPPMTPWRNPVDR